jgi:hypothetical protein
MNDSPTVYPLDRQNFEAWYAGILEKLYPNRDAGFIIATIAFPLLERYLRQRVRLPADQSLNDRFHAELMTVIAGFRDLDQAKEFWAAFRNGLLHQVTLQLETRAKKPLPTCALTHDIPRIFATDAKRNILVLHPVLFAQRVIDLIRADFATFVGQVHIGPPLSTAQPLTFYGRPVLHTATVSTTPMRILGTSTGP